MRRYRPLWLDLVNSEQWDGFGHRTDHLGEREWLVAFLRHAELARFARGAAPEEALRRLRNLLRHVVETSAAGRRLTAADAAALDAWLGAAARRRFVPADDGFRVYLEPVRGGWPWVLTTIAASAAATLADANLRRLKVCANPGCRWAFWDQTKGNQRRWCNDRTCGNRDKVRRFRARQLHGGPDMAPKPQTALP